jgi:adenylate cyclase
VADVFVSYTANDRDRVSRLVEMLQATGLTVWWDRGIDVGSTFDREIEREIDGAGCVVVVWSSASVDSEWVRNEAFEAQSRDALVPILIDDVKPPLAFRRAQTARMLEWPGSVGEFDAMLHAVQGKLAKQQPPLESQPPQTHGRVPATDPRGASIVVLPLSNVSPDPEQVHFVDGLTIELIHRLSRIPNLRVAGQTSSFAYKNRPVSYAEVGRTLGIAHLLEGSVRKAGDRLRVTVQLVSTANGFQLWSADFDRQLDDVFAIQREISDAVADALSVKLRGDSLELLGTTRIASAHAHYLRGNALHWQHTAETAERAIAELEEAVAIDPGFARAWEILALAYGARARRLESTAQSLREMSQAVERALQSEPLLWRAHAAKGWYLLSRRQFVAADAAIKEASRLRHGQESIVGPELMNYLSQVGRWTERLEECERLQSMDPVLGANHDALYVLDRKEEARNAFTRLKGLSPLTDRYYLDMLAMDQPSAEAAERIVEGFSKTTYGRAWFGPSDEVLTTLRQQLAAGNRFRGAFAVNAMIASQHRDIDLAIDFLRAEYLVDGFGAWFLLWYPQLKRVRASAKFKTFLIELGLPDMWRTTGSWGDFCEPVGDHDFRCR